MSLCYSLPLLALASHSTNYKDATNTTPARAGNSTALGIDCVQYIPDRMIHESTRFITLLQSHVIALAPVDL
ncbi:hypothetical protein BS47DRAFT_1342730 [Hydnum rufescens UP504]|uniref:Uncharacterized protein n=1 Tax=Hydnum rufescens UP504 TaxID=1448309 RepID=A0A9P6AZ93_9AGAM|nr:hypothetical protein BS47DRAFT_1342730 [Hydnum rufescens UP504]